MTCTCGQVWPTRANPRVRLVCRSCGAVVLAPPIDDPWQGPGGSKVPMKGSVAPPAPAGASPPSDRLRGATITRPAATVAKAAPPPAPPADPGAARRKAQTEAGRRGGLAPGIRRRLGR